MSRPIHTDSRVLRPIIEALIFASEDPLPPRLLVRLLAGERDDAKGSIEEPEVVDDGAQAPSSADQSTVAAGEMTSEADPETADADREPVAGSVPTTSSASEARTDVSTDVGANASTEVSTDARTDVSTEESAESASEAVHDVRLPDASESPDALASAYVDLSRDYSERLFPGEQIVTIDQRIVRRLIDDLNAEYDETGRAFRIVEVAGGFQFATIREYGEYVALLSKEKLRRRLSPAALESLAIIAFRQPISKPEIEAIRGVNSDQVLLSLLEKTLVAITGRSESVGRPLLYGTTDEFLRIFGLNSLNELPKLREIEELMEEDAYSAEKIEVVNVDPASNVEQIEAMVGAAGHVEGEEQMEYVETHHNADPSPSDVDQPDDE